MVCCAQDGTIVLWICWWLASSAISFVTSAAHRPISQLFSWKQLSYLALPLPFFHCFNASCQIECLWDSFLDYRALEVFFFRNPASALFSPTFTSSSCFIFSWDSRSVFPISLLTQILTSNFLCVTVAWERSWCGANEAGHILLNQLLFSLGS